MWFEWVHAVAFGPLQDQLLRFSPGLNVVTGGNEAGKSSWHAATFAALCGMRRGRGRPHSHDEQFAARHAPWDGGPWQVRALVTLADGRRVELEQDLKGRVACRAADADLGRDYSNEIMWDGAPDGSRWLGLDRRAFVATACVRQTDLLGCLREPGLLQEHLQAAAGTAGTEGTVAAALERLERCRSERVGLDRSNSVKPLPTARRRLAEAEAALQRVRMEHEEYLRLAEQAKQEAEAEAEARHRLALVEAAQAEVIARRERRGLARAEALAARHPDGPPRPLLSAAAPGMDGSTSLDPQIATSADRYRLAAEALRRHRVDRPATPPTASKEPPLDPARQESLKHARHRLDGPFAHRSGALLLLLAAGVAVAGTLLMLSGRAALGAIALILGAAGITVGLRFGDRQRLALLEDIRALEQPTHERWAAEQWVSTDQRLLTEVDEAAARLATALRDRGIIVEQDVEEAMDRYAEQSRASAVAALRDAHREWSDLQALLQRRTLDELKAEVERREAAAERLRGALALEDLAAVDLETDTAAQLRRLAQAVDEASEAAAFTRGQLERDARVLQQVPDAEEELAAAREELARVEQLGGTLDRTMEFLRAAQDRVHRDMAPILAHAIRHLLPEITLGRYNDARVDPASLAVQVRERGGRWRQAELLSHGTAEQVYLLLRVALAQHLTRAGEVCPLLLDDVTVQSDHERTEAIVRTLAVVSRQRQVILFSQEQQVRAWALVNLSAGDQLIELDAAVPQPA